MPVPRFSSNPAVNTAIKLCLSSVAMFTLVFVVMVPLYNVLCDALGINGKTSDRVYQAVSSHIDTSRRVTVKFVAINNDDMPWSFEPSKRVLQVYPGQANLTVFKAANPMNHGMVAQAIPSIAPSRAAAYFHKTECFCFNQQELDANSATEMPLQFIVDQDLPLDIHTVTLSYTVFDITEKPSRAFVVR